MTSIIYKEGDFWRWKIKVTINGVAKEFVDGGNFLSEEHALKDLGETMAAFGDAGKGGLR